MRYIAGALGIRLGNEDLRMSDIWAEWYHNGFGSFENTSQGVAISCPAARRAARACSKSSAFVRM